MKRVIVFFLFMIFIVGCTGINNDEQTTITQIQTEILDANEQEENLKMIMVMAVDKIHSGSFSQSAWDGLKWAQKDYEFGAEQVLLGELTDENYEASKEKIMPYIERGDILICAVGADLADLIQDLAFSNPNTQFVLMDHQYEEQIPNIKTINFRDNEVAYLAGIIAGRMSVTNKVGFVGGVESPLIDKFKYGFMAGVREGSWSGRVDSLHTNSFLDINAGERTADILYQRDCDVIYHAAGHAGNGVIKSAVKNGKMVIGCDRDQYYLAPKNVIASTIKNIDLAFANICNTYLQEGYDAIEPHTEYGFFNGGLEISKGAEKQLSNELLEYLDIQKERIKNEQIHVPYDEITYEEFIKRYE